MNEDHQTQTKTYKIEHYEDEIELIDILRVIWKWKHFILAGTVVCGLIAAIISFNMNKVYCIDMVLEPGLLSLGALGKKVYIDSPQNIKALIGSGKFNNDILNYLNDNKIGKVPRKLDFKVTIGINSDIINVKYETANINQGIAIQDLLGKLLIREYSNSVQYFKSEYDDKCRIKKDEIDYFKAIIQSRKKNVKNIEKRNNELLNEIKSIKNNKVNIVKEKDKLLLKSPQKKYDLQHLFYTYLIQDDARLSNNYLNQINDYKLKKENQLIEIQHYTREIDKKIIEINKLQTQKENIQNIQILEPPSKSQYPVRPKTKLNVIFALLIGLFLMMLFSFFLEYFRNYKNRKTP